MSVYVDIEKNFGSFKLKSSFSAGDGTLALLGASGSGKSLTLKCIAGVETPDKGKIILDGKTLFDSEKHINLTPQERHTGILFQNYALFPNMTVLQNIRTGAAREKDKVRREALVNEIITVFGLSQLTNRYPRELSGGEQQRTALARLLVSNPDILMLDEPFSALDSHLRFRTESYLRDVIKRFGKTIILVTHDRDEVYRLADKIAVIDNGNIVSFGEKEEIFTAPKTRTAALLTGCKNISAIKIIDENHILAVDWGITLSVPAIDRECGFVGIRERDIVHDGDENRVECIVSEAIENPLSITVLLIPKMSENKTAIAWELQKEEWQRLKAEKLSISIPKENILLLRG